ncbi:MAG TPA: DUF4428 domain-containing protein, partial [Methanobacterium sp.]|nr:DUF4428 domain-containing protein [Methanobacterium sp.]
EGNMSQVMEEKRSAIKKFSQMPDKEFLIIEELDKEQIEIPGLPKEITICSICGEHVMDKKEVKIDDETVCQSCQKKIKELRILIDH